MARNVVRRVTIGAVLVDAAVQRRPSVWTVSMSPTKASASLLALTIPYPILRTFAFSRTVRLAGSATASGN